jgi:gliding motility-associated-like protein
MCKHIFYYVIFLLAGWHAGPHTVQAQCTSQVTHISGTQVINCVNVTVTSFGETDVLPSYCPSVTTPYLIGYSFANGNGDGGYTFNFSPPINAATLNFSGISNTFPSSEEVMLFVNGTHYPIPTAGSLNACDAMALLTPGGNVGGCIGCSVSGWSGTNIVGPISTLTVFDTISGAPAGCLFSLYICNPVVPAGGTVDLGNDTTLCPGNNLLLDATVAGSTYHWQDNSTNSTFNVTTPGTYYVAVNTGCGIIYDTIVVNFTNSAVVDLGPDQSICAGNTVLLDATFPGATYAWQDASTNPTFNVTATGTYFVEVSNICGTDYDTIVVNIAPSPVVDLGPDQSLCPGDTLMLDVATTGATYLWNDHTTNPTYLVTTPGTFWVELDLNGCIGADTINVSFGTAASVDLGNDTTICLPNSYILNGSTPGSTYLWQDNSTNPTLNVTATGTYWIQVTNSCGVAGDTIDLIFNTPPIVSLGNDSILCLGQVINYDVTIPGATYEWQNNSTQPVFTVTTPGVYWVELNTGGCIDADTVNIQYYNLNIANWNIDTVLCDGTTISLDATSTNATYLWQDNSMNSTYTVTTPGDYKVTIFTPCGNFTDSAKVEYRNCECYLYIPNAFTPNQDELNQYYSPITACILKNYRLIIFDRWGREIFVTEDPMVKWDGTDNGIPYPMGVYAYQVEFEYNIPHSLPETRIGHVNLLR